MLIQSTRSAAQHAFAAIRWSVQILHKLSDPTMAYTNNAANEMAGAMDDFSFYHELYDYSTHVLCDCGNVVLLVPAHA